MEPPSPTFAEHRAPCDRLSPPVLASAPAVATVESASTEWGQGAGLRTQAEAPLDGWRTESETEAVVERGSRDWLGQIVSATGLLALEGFSIGIAVWQFAFSNAVADYVTRNQLPTTGYSSVGPGWSGASLATLLVVMGWIAMAWGRMPAVELVHGVSLRLAPCLVVALVPSLFHYEIWVGRKLGCLVTIAVLVFGLQRTSKLALSAPPLAPALHPVWDRWRRDAAAVLDVVSTIGRRRARWLPLLLVCLGAMGYTAFFSYHTVVHHRNVLSSSLDLGLEDNLVYNTWYGARLFKSSPLGGPTATHLGYHSTWFAFLLAPIYALRPNAETLLIIQAVLIGAGALPLFLLGCRYVSRWLACIVAFCFLMYAPLHGSNLYDFHYLPLGTFFLWFTVYFADARRWILASVFALLSLSVREDIAFSLAVMGAFLVLSGRRPKAGLSLALVGVAYFFLMKGFVMRKALGGQDSFVYQYQQLVAPGEQGFAGVLATIIGNPAFTLNTLVLKDKLVYLSMIMLPLAFFPLRRPIGLLCCVPGFVFTLLSTGHQPLLSISFQYTAYWSAHLFLAVLANLAWAERRVLTGGRTARASKWAWVVAIVVGTLVTSYQFGAVLQQHTVQGGFGPYHFGTTKEDVTRRDDLAKLLAKVPPMAKIVASENVVPQVSNRPDAYTLRIGLYDAEYLLFSTPVWSDERTHVLEGIEPGTFGVVAESGHYVLAKRGHPTAGNSRVLTKIKGLRSD